MVAVAGKSRGPRRDIGAYAAFLAAILILPFLHSDRLLDPDSLPKFIGLSAINLFLAIWLINHPRETPGAPTEIHPGVCLLTGYLALAAVASCMAANPGEAVFAWLKQALFAQFLFLSIAAGADRPGARVILFKGMTVFVLAASLYALIEYHLHAREGGELAATYQVIGTFAHKNFFADIILLALPFCLFGALTRSGIWRGLAALALALALPVLFLFQTRSVWVAGLFGGMGAAALACWGMESVRKDPASAHASGKSGKLWAGALVASLAIAAMFGKVLPSNPIERLASSFRPGQNEWRVLIWGKSLEMAANHPWLGVGPGNWKIHFPAYGMGEIRRVGGTAPDKDDFALQLQYPHNDFINALCETGIPGALMYCGFFAALIFAGAKPRRGIHAPESGIWAACMVGGVLAYMVDAFFSFPGERIAQPVFLAMMAGTILAGHRPAFRLQVPVRLRSYSAIAALAVPCMGIALGVERIRAESGTREALLARESGRWQDVISAVDRAQSPWYTLDPYANPLTFHRGIAQFLEGNIAEARADFESAARSHPYNVHVLNNLGAALESEGRHNKALASFRRAIAISPDFNEARLNAAIATFNSGDTLSAKEAFRRITAMPDDPRWRALEAKLSAKE